MERGRERGRSVGGEREIEREREREKKGMLLDLSALLQARTLYLILSPLLEMVLYIPNSIRLEGRALKEVETGQ